MTGSAGGAALGRHTGLTPPALSLDAFSFSFLQDDGGKALSPFPVVFMDLVIIEAEHLKRYKKDICNVCLVT